MSEVKNNEYIEISITDILSRLWRNKTIFLLVLIASLTVGGIFLAKKNYNNYTYSANISLPINSGGTLLVSSELVSDAFSNKYSAENKKLSIKNDNTYSVNITYSSKQPIHGDRLDKKVNDFVDFLNNSNILERATLNYVNSLNDANQHIKLLQTKIKEYQLKKRSEISDIGITMLQDSLITYNSQKLQANLNLENAKFTVSDISIDHSMIGKKKYILVIVLLSLMLSVFAALGVDFLREKFLNKNNT